MVLEFVQVGDLRVIEFGRFKDEPFGDEAPLTQAVENNQVADELSVWGVI